MLCHWDEVAEVAGVRDVGGASGAVRIGARACTLAPGGRSAAAGPREGEEEMSFVVAGTGLSRQGAVTYAVGAGDALLHRGGGPAHSLVAGGEGMTAIVFGPARRTAAAAGPLAAAGAPSPRSPQIVAVAGVPADERNRGEFGATLRNIGLALESRSTGMRHATIAPGRMNAPPHCHSAEEELFVVLAGDGAVVLYDLDGAVTAEHAVRAGHVVARPAGTGVAHAFRAGAGGMTVLSYGERKGEDVGFYPRSQKLAVRGFGGSGVLGGVVFRVQRADYWDGEA
jgi:uncharacterized cupin superfamily protein